MTPQPPYRYRVVSGKEVLSGDFRNILPAKVCVLRVRSTFSFHKDPNAEIERRLALPNGGHRVWRWRGRDWSGEVHSAPTPSDLARWDKR